MKVLEYSFSLGRRCINGVLRRSSGCDDGVVATPWGFVWARAQGDDRRVCHSSLRFVHGGRYHVRNFKGKRYTSRGLARKAKEFAREIALGY